MCFCLSNGGYFRKLEVLIMSRKEQEVMREMKRRWAIRCSEGELFCFLCGQQIKNMKDCDYILCMISDNYRKSEVCQNEMGAAWAMEGKRMLPFKFPNVKFTEIGFLNVVKQAADITDKSKLDELYEEFCISYNVQPDWKNYNNQKEEFVKLVSKYK